MPPPYPMSYEEARAELSIWAVLASPLIMGNDPQALTPECIDILTNKEVCGARGLPLRYVAVLISAL